MCIIAENKSALFTNKQIKNDELRGYANEILNNYFDMRAHALQVAAIMATIASRREDGILEEFDNSIVKFANDRLGLKKTQTYDLVSVGATFLKEDGTSKLAARNGSKWTSTQFIALLPMAGTGKDKKNADETLEACQKLVKDKKIHSAMSVADIKKVVAEERPDKAKREAAKAKREAKKQEKDQQEAQATAKLHGNKIASIEFYQLEDGSIHVAFDGDVKDFNMNNIKEIEALLEKAVNYKRD